MKDIEIWFHCWCGNANFHVPASRILTYINIKFDKLKKSGLYDNTKKIFVIAHGISHKNEFIFEDLVNSYNKVELIKLPVGKIGHESDTLNLMMERYKKNDLDVNVLFFHTKGFSYPENIPFTNRMNKWVRYMDLFLIKFWKDCQKNLETHDTDGIFLFVPDEDSRKDGEPANRKTYAGWFWWSKSQYIKKLPYLTHRMDKGKGGEFWLLDHPDVNYHLTLTDFPWLKNKDFHQHEMDDEHFFPNGW